MAALETVDVADVEILSAGGPVHGVGSPPEGDFWSADDLEGIAAANRELAGELQAPNKIGHSDAQALLLNSGMLAPTPGEMPAVGWLDGATFRVEERDGVAKLLADARDVPAKFAELLKTKAYRTRSVELSRVESQEQLVDGKPKVYDWVVTGLAWLGAKLPAVRTLDDIVALYEHEQLAKPDARVFVVYAAGDVVWDPEDGFQDLRDDVNEALNGPSTGGMIEPRFWVADIAITLDKALVQDYFESSSADAWVVPFTRDANDNVTIAPSSDWVEVEQGWVEAARELEARVTVPRRRADIRRDVDAKTFSAEQRKAFADALGLDEEKLTDEQIAAAAELVVPKQEDKPVDDDKRDLEQDGVKRELAETRASVKTLQDELHDERKRNFVESLVSDGKINPGDTEKWEKRYDADPATAREYAADLAVNEDFLREYGSDSDTLTDEDREAEERSYEDDASRRLQLPKESLV